MRKPDYDRRVAVTGLGVVSPIGQDVDTVWSNLAAGKSGLGAITRFDVSKYEAQVAGEIDGFDSREVDGLQGRAPDGPQRGDSASPRRSRRSPTRASVIGPENRDDIGVIFGSGGGGPSCCWTTSRSGNPAGRAAVSPFFIANMLPDTASGQIAIETGIRGHNMCVVTACSTGTHNIGEAAEAHPARRRRGGHRGCHRVAAPRDGPHRLLEHARHGPAAARRGPGDRFPAVRQDAGRLRARRGVGGDDARGHGHGPGRGAKIYAEVASVRLCRRRVGPDPAVEKGDGVRRAMLAALERRDIRPDEIDMINPHGTSTPLGDLREAQAIHDVFGDWTPHVAISATKSLTGHLMGAAGAFEGVATVLSVYHQCAPATANYRDEDPEIDLDIVTGGARSMEIRYAMSDNIGLGGHNGAVIFKRYDG